MLTEQEVENELKLWSYIPGTQFSVHFSGTKYRYYELTIAVPAVDVRPPYKDITIRRSTPKGYLNDLTLDKLKLQIQQLVFDFARHEASEWLQRSGNPVVTLHGANHTVQ